MCDKKFTWTGYLQTHLQGHGTEKNWKVVWHVPSESCGKEGHCWFWSRQQRDWGWANTLRRAGGLMSKKPHICTVCGKGFPYNGQLKAHNKTHIHSTRQVRWGKEIVKQPRLPKIVICVEKPIVENMKWGDTCRKEVMVMVRRKIMVFNNASHSDNVLEVELT